MFDGKLKTNLVLFVVSMMLLGGLATVVLSGSADLMSSAPISLAGGGWSGGGSTNGG